MLHFYSSQPIVTRGSRITRAPTQYPPAFLNLNGMIEENNQDHEKF